MVIDCETNRARGKIVVGVLLETRDGPIGLEKWRFEK